MLNKIELGKLGQEAAEVFLINKGFSVLERNFRGANGEIDLIVNDNEYIVFTEVKCRSGLQYGYPRESVNNAKQRHIKKTAMFYIVKHKLTEQDFRFDVLEVYNDNGQFHVEHIENAFW